MALGRRGGERQEELWIPTAAVARGPGHPFCDRLNELLAEAGFDRWVEERCLCSTPRRAEQERAFRDNWRRIHGRRGRRLQRLRRVLCERSFAHTCETGAGRRSWLRGLVNVSKRYVIHAAAYNLGVILRKLFGVGTPRSLQGRAAAACAALFAILWALHHRLAARTTGPRDLNPIPTPITPSLSRLAAA